MGKEIKDDTVDSLEAILGLGGDDAKEEIPKADEIPKVEEKLKEEELAKPAQNTTTLTDEQLSINKNVAKIDLQIEALKETTVDISEFFNNLETHLSDAEIQLEFDDKPAYMKLINEKSKEYEATHSKADEIKQLEEQKVEQESIYARSGAISEVTAKLPDYNHEAMIKFFQENLSKSEQEKIIANSNSYAEVYENTYNKHNELNPKEIASTTTPNIPNVNNTRRQSVSTKDVSKGSRTADENIQSALGL